jgi:hypothetical protein
MYEAVYEICPAPRRPTTRNHEDQVSGTQLSGPHVPKLRMRVRFPSSAPTSKAPVLTEAACWFNSIWATIARPYQP